MAENNQVEFTQFEDRTSSNPNRRKLKIVSQSPNEIVVDVERDDGTPNQIGTPLNAQSINSRLTEIKDDLQNLVTQKTGSIVQVKNAQGVYEAKDVKFDSDPQTQINTEITNRTNADSSLQTQITNISNNTTKIMNTMGGFSGGSNAQVTAGGAIGMNTSTTSGFSGGHSAVSDWGGAIGVNSNTQMGGAVGSSSISNNGGAIGSGTKTGDGLAGGANAKTVDSNNNGIDAIQLGSGTNSQSKTLQIYNDNIYNANTHTMNIQGSINTNSIYNINNVQIGKTRNWIGDYTGNDNTTVTISSLAGYSYFEIVFKGVSNRIITTGLNSCVNNARFSCYYPNAGGIRGYKISDTSLRIDDLDGTTNFSVYGIK